MAAGFLSVLGKRLVCLEMQIAFDAEMEAVADQGKLGQADVAQLRETEAEERVAVFWIDLRVVGVVALDGECPVVEGDDAFEAQRFGGDGVAAGSAELIVEGDRGGMLFG